MGDRVPAGDPGDLADGEPLPPPAQRHRGAAARVPRPASSPSTSCAIAWPGCSTWASLVDVGSPDRLAAGERFLDDLAARVRAYPQTEVSDVRTGFADRARLRGEPRGRAARPGGSEDRSAQRIEDRLHWEYAKETGTLLDDNEPAPPLDFSDIEKKYSTRAGRSALEGDRFSSSKLGVTLMLIEVGGFSTSAAQSAALIDGCAPT